MAETELEAVEARLAKLYSQPPSFATFVEILNTLIDASARWPAPCEEIWIPQAEGVVHGWGMNFGIPITWIQSYAARGVRYPFMRLFNQAATEGYYLSPDEARAIFSHPDLCHLEVISWPSGNLYNQGLSAIIDAIGPDRLRVLDVQDNRIGDDGAVALAESGKLSALTHLGLFRNHLNRRGVRAILQSTNLGALQMLSLGYQNSLSNRSLSEELADAPKLGRLRELRVEHCDLDDEDLQRLAEAPGLAGLGAIYLTGNPVSDRGLDALRSAPHTAGTRIHR